MATKKKNAAVSEPKQATEITSKDTIKDTGKTAPSAPPELVTPTHKLNLREGPHKGYAVLDKLDPGVILMILPLPCGAEVPGWSLVEVAGSGAVGWVNADYITGVA